MKKILIIDDSAFFRSQMAQTLRDAGYEVICAQTGEEGLELVLREKPDLVLLDVVLPGMSGFDVCRTLRDNESNNLMPILMLTSRDDQEDKLVGLELGADDYITKPCNERELLSRIRNTLRRIDRNRAANPLTGLSGNLEIHREIDSRIARDEPFAVIYADLDNFKSFNDVYGFAQGDRAIKLTADVLQNAVRLYGAPDDFVGHVGGDDFVLVTRPQHAEEICQAAIEEFDARIVELYHKEDIERGYLVAVNRRGEEEHYPITTISLAVASSEAHKYTSHLEVSAVTSEIKALLKAYNKSNYLIDRRK